MKISWNKAMQPLLLIFLTLFSLGWFLAFGTRNLWLESEQKAQRLYTERDTLLHELQRVQRAQK